MQVVCLLKTMEEPTIQSYISIGIVPIEDTGKKSRVGFIEKKQERGETYFNFGC